MPTYLGVDLGTSGLRGVLIDQDLQVLAHAALPYPGAWLDSNVWLLGLEQLAAIIRKQNPPAWRAIKAITFDGTSGTLLPCAVDGSALMPALAYSDQRAEAEAQWLHQHWPTGGIVLSPASSLNKLLWLRNHLSHFDALRYIHHPADWVAAQLTGHFGVSDRGNLLKLGVIAQTLGYPPELLRILEQVGIDPRLLPTAVREGTAVATVRASWTKRLALPVHIEVRAGCTDSVAAAMAAGLSRPGQALSSLGSSLACKVVHSRPINNNGIYSHFLDEYCLVGTASNAGGASLLRYFSRDEMQTMTALLCPDSPTGALFYPLPKPGERFPLNAPQWSGSEIPPLKTAAIFQGLLEGLSYIEAWMYSTLKQAGVRITAPIRSVGGGSENAKWMQMRANILNHPIEVLTNSDAATGAALLAASSEYGSVEATIQKYAKVGRIIMPDPDAAEKYQPYTKKFLETFVAASSY